MKKIILLSLSIILLFQNAFGQKPQYEFDTSIIIAGYKITAGAIIGDRAEKMQCIYTPSLFPGMPEGDVTAVYFKSTPSLEPTDTAIYTAFGLSMGHTRDSCFPNRQFMYDTFKTVTPVYGPKKLVIYHADSPGLWVRIPVEIGSFKYTKEQNFVVEFRKEARTDPHGVNLTLAHLRQNSIFYDPILAGHPDSFRLYQGGIAGFFVIGLDIASTNVTPQSIVTSLGLFPNPAEKGQFNVSFSSQHPVKLATVTVNNVMGQEVFKKSFTHPGAHFFESFNLSGAVPGNYFVTINADNERHERKLIIR